MIVSSEKELNTLRESGRRLAEISHKLAAAVKPGVSTKDLDSLAEALILSSGASPAFKGYRASKRERPFPASICASVNDEVVHAIPRSDRILKEGDIVSVDFGMRYPAEGGLITDMAFTAAVGLVSPKAEELLKITEESLARGLEALKAGATLGDVGFAIQSHIEEGGFKVVRELMGHGVGRHLHEQPNVPNFGSRGEGEIIRENSVLAIEPMAAMGSAKVVPAGDGWTWRTEDGSLAAHFEHTVVVTKNGAEVLTEAG